jgi:hypothetical protein
MNKILKRILIITGIIILLSVIAYFAWAKFTYMPTQQLDILSDDTVGDLTESTSLERTMALGNEDDIRTPQN